MRETIDYNPIEAFIEQGRLHLSKGENEKARWCFEQVLERRPEDPRALLGLSHIRKSQHPSTVSGGVKLDLEVLQLVKEKRYEEALDLLRQERLRRPDDAAVARSIEHLEKHIQKKSHPPSKLSVNDELQATAARLAAAIPSVGGDIKLPAPAPLPGMSKSHSATKRLLPTAPLAPRETARTISEIPGPISLEPRVIDDELPRARRATAAVGTFEPIAEAAVIDEAPRPISSRPGAIASAAPLALAESAESQDDTAEAELVESQDERHSLEEPKISVGRWALYALIAIVVLVSLALIAREIGHHVPI